MPLCHSRRAISRPMPMRGRMCVSPVLVKASSDSGYRGFSRGAPGKGRELVKGGQWCWGWLGEILCLLAGRKDVGWDGVGRKAMALRTVAQNSSRDCRSTTAMEEVRE